MKYLTILFLLIAQLSFGQSKSLTKVINQIDYQNDTIQAVFDWVTDNIKYDVAKLKKSKKEKSSFKKGKHKNVAEYKADKLEKVIKKKKGVCQDYSDLFDAIVSELGYTSIVIAGVTKDFKGNVRSSGGHTWNAVKVNNEWKLFDPTWGAGIVKNKKRFVKKYSPQWYDVNPEEMKKRHFPFDPMWQLSENPMTYQEFKKGIQSDEINVPYDYKGMIETHFNKGGKEQLEDELSRSELNGGNIQPILKRRKTLKRKIEFYGVSSNRDLIKSTVQNCRESSDLFGEYIREAKNKNFKGKKWTLEYSHSAMLEIQDQVTESIATFESIDVKDSKNKKSFKKYISQSKSLLEKIEKELVYLDGKM